MEHDNLNGIKKSNEFNKDIKDIKNIKVEIEKDKSLPSDNTLKLEFEKVLYPFQVAPSPLWSYKSRRYC